MHTILLIEEVRVNVVVDDSFEETSIVLGDIAVWLEGGCRKLFWIADEYHFVRLIEERDDVVGFTALCCFVDDKYFDLVFESLEFLAH